ncbi:hypothetical protein EYF80_064046 [Liparis tanakae]|uniref:Uncharacterized protein n=1 Tax=Liparis tanakae TaxID=230148 RepID=A0A4Z2EBY8_9TELE|nr:hypothetical protein EYF80_064046 [Liparis tanakae]
MSGPGRAWVLGSRNPACRVLKLKETDSVFAARGTRYGQDQNHGAKNKTTDTETRDVGGTARRLNQEE